ncbi:MAG: nicotinamide mononucleotide transporter [Muribaculaceae bacterium]|nr:nicotinamide mononucleotide transporter [Muribaculaceae bacterium]
MIDAVAQYFADFNWIKAIDLAGLVLGLIYLWLEFKASIWLWLVSVIMPIVHGYLYWARGLYADFGMEVYYVLAAVYGYAMWRWVRVRGGNGNNGEQALERPITRFPLRRVLPVALIGLALWALIYWILITFTDSSVPVCDSFTTALSMVALWALAQKYAEQWLLWLVVDAVCTVLYIYKQIPFTACLYGFYTVMAVLGYRQWLKKIPTAPTKY